MTRKVLAHEPDIKWLIALWKAIYGGDPGPSDRVAAAEILAGVVSVLNGKAVGSLPAGRLANGIKELGAEIGAKSR